MVFGHTARNFQLRQQICFFHLTPKAAEPKIWTIVQIFGSRNAAAGMWGV
jgi:hypothetical protein